MHSKVEIYLMGGCIGAGFAKKSFRMIALDRLSEDYLFTKAIADHKSSTEIIGELVREKIASADI